MQRNFYQGWLKNLPQRKVSMSIVFREFSYQFRMSSQVILKRNHYLTAIFPQVLPTLVSDFQIPATGLSKVSITIKSILIIISTTVHSIRIALKELFPSTSLNTFKKNTTGLLFSTSNLKTNSSSWTNISIPTVSFTRTIRSF